MYEKLEVQLLNKNVEHGVHERSHEVHTSTHQYTSSTHPVHAQYHWSTESYKSVSVRLVHAGLLKVHGADVKSLLPWYFSVVLFAKNASFRNNEAICGSTRTEG